MEWTWDTAKDRLNKRKHGIGFAVAQLVFEDPLALMRDDPHPDNDRWQTIGMVGPVALFVVHTGPEYTNGGMVGRIISARKVNNRERRAYEEGNFQDADSRATCPA